MSVFIAITSNFIRNDFKELIFKTVGFRFDDSINLHFIELYIYGFMVCYDCMEKILGGF